MPVSGEPTGSLNEDTAEEIADLFMLTAYEEKRRVVAVTRLRDLACRADRVSRFKRSRLVRERKRRVDAPAKSLFSHTGGAAQPINPHGRPLPPANHTVSAACSLHPAECGAEQPARRPKQDPHSPPPRAPRRRAPRRPSSRASPPWRRTAPPGARTGSPARGAHRP